jgi:hypothetical protein
VYEVLKRVLMPIAILVAVCLACSIAYQVAYAVGGKEGYDKGYNSGHNVGYSAGIEDGYDEGYISGEEDGYAEGYATGKADGYNEGASAGLDNGYTLIDPTYGQAVHFLHTDKTSDNRYIEGSYGIYVCSHFARDVCNNAEEQGFRCAYVEIRYPDGGHAIVAFNTVDEGLVYFDAMTDERVRPVIGSRYYQCIEPREGYYYEPPLFDDTIKDILVIW